MNISSLSTSTPAAAMHATQRRQPPPAPQLTQTAQLLGTTAEDLQKQTASGTTLNQIATEKGVSSEELLKTITADLKAGKPSDAPELSDSQLTVFAGKVASSSGPQGPGGPGGPRGPGGPGGPPPAGGPRGASETEDTSANLSTLADALGTDSDSLLEMLNSVQDLGSLLAKSGVTGYGSAGSGVTTSGLAVDEYA